MLELGALAVYIRLGLLPVFEMGVVFVCTLNIGRQFEFIYKVERVSFYFLQHHPLLVNLLVRDIARSLEFL